MHCDVPSDVDTISTNNGIDLALKVGDPLTISKGRSNFSVNWAVDSNYTSDLGQHLFRNFAVFYTKIALLVTLFCSKYSPFLAPAYKPFVASLHLEHLYWLNSVFIKFFF